MDGQSAPDGIRPLRGVDDWLRDPCSKPHVVKIKKDTVEENDVAGSLDRPSIQGVGLDTFAYNSS
jgi:hypothetical protein